MLGSGILFGILFLFLTFIFLIFTISWFFKGNRSGFEPKVTIVIPAYNEENNITECIDSIFSSSYKKN